MVINGYYFLVVSVVTEGRQMIPVLNSLNVSVALYGNHDFGKEQYSLMCHSLTLSLSPLVRFWG